MKTVEIVLATNGENLLWANGLQSIITEYSTSPQKPHQKVKHLKLDSRLGHRNAGFGNIDPMQEFISDLKERIKYAKEMYVNLATILNFNEDPKSNKNVYLSGHKVVSIENDPNMCEANHFLTHITKNYDSLSDSTFFIQGFPHDHCSNILTEIIKSIGADFQTLPKSQKRSLGKNDHD